MRREDVFVQVRRRNLTRVGTITSAYLQLTATLRWSNVGSWELKLPGDHPLADELSTAGSGIIVSLRGQVAFSGPTVKPMRVRDRVNPDGTLTFAGVTDEIVLADALAFPSPSIANPAAQTAANDVRTGTAESLMRQYVAANLVAGTAPAGRLSGLRQFIRLGGSDLARGVTLTKSPRFQNLLELLQEISTLSPDLGFRVVQRGTELAFEIVKAADRRGFVSFDIDNGSVTSEQIEQSGPSLTRAIVAGQGVGVDRLIVQRTTADSLAGEATWGRVVERFIDRRDASVLAELNQSGDEPLIAEGSAATSVKLVPSDDQTMLYGIDWNAGDLVRVIVDGSVSESNVTGAAFIVDDSGVFVGASLGDVANFDKSVSLVKRVDDIEQRTSKLERVESGSGDIAALLAALLPAGTITQTARTTAPDGYLLCQGQAVSRTEFASLFSAIGTVYGVGNGSTTFGIPDMRGRAAVGLSATETEFDSLNEAGGVKSVSLTAAQNGEHTHTQNAHTHDVSDPGHNHSQNSHNHSQDSHNHSQNAHSHVLRGPVWRESGGNVQGVTGSGASVDQGLRSNATTATNNATTATNNATTATNNSSTTGLSVANGTAVNQNSGSGQAHENLQPYRVLNFQIKT